MLSDALPFTFFVSYSRIDSCCPHLRSKQNGQESSLLSRSRGIRVLLIRWLVRSWWNLLLTGRVATLHKGHEEARRDARNTQPSWLAHIHTRASAYHTCTCTHTHTHTHACARARAYVCRTGGASQVHGRYAYNRKIAAEHSFNRRQTRLIDAR